MDPEPDYGEKSYVGHGRLKDRVALITGADSGIGRAVALAFAREGAHITAGYFSSDRDAKETERVIKEAGQKVLLSRGDIGEPDYCQKLVNRTIEQFGRLDILVNNAAYQGEALESFEDISPERIERTFRTNIMAMFYLVRAALPHLKAGATIINVASIQAYKPSPPIIDYAATKGAIVNFTKALSQEMAQRGIRVNCVAPGPVWTPLIPQSFHGEKVVQFGKSAPLGRPAQPVELAPAFVFLASEESSYVTGEVLGVTGGEIMP